MTFLGWWMPSNLLRLWYFGFDLWILFVSFTKKSNFSKAILKISGNIFFSLPFYFWKSDSALNCWKNEKQHFCLSYFIFSPILAQIQMTSLWISLTSGSSRPGVFLGKRFSENIQQICRRTPFVKLHFGMGVLL